MTWEVVLLLVTGLLVGLLMSGLWIAFGLGIAGVIVLLLWGGPAALNALGPIAWNTVESFVLTSVPLFILMGEVILRAGLSDGFYRSMGVWFSGLRGGLLQSNIVACAIFAAVSGSSVATAAAIGTVAIPEMLKRGYERRILFGSLAAGGTLGILIPPSIPMIIYAALVEQSVERLFIAGVLPGIVMSLVFMAYIWVHVALRPRLVPPETAPASWSERLRSVVGVGPMALLILLVLGSIWLGYATPTEAAAVGASAAIALSLLARRLTWRVFTDSVAGTVRTTCMVLFIIVGAQILSYALVRTGASRALTAWVVGLGLSRWLLFAIIILLYVFLGCIIDGVSMMVLTLPILYPIVVGAGFDPIWFGIVLVIMIELGGITPPVGLNMFVIQGLSGGRPMSEIVWGSLPFGVLMLVVLVLISIFPDLVTWLPNHMVRR
ncbi:MAG TPA: TRAP transporter large permease subunit [Methylomirabilota bacterium]|jgi:tripartite ATP-independent transporter DctM subunit